MIEILGYVATLFVMVSFSMKDVTMLRIINLIGCLLFLIYAVLIDSMPIIITNMAIVVINTYHLIKKN